MAAEDRGKRYDLLMTPTKECMDLLYGGRQNFIDVKEMSAIEEFLVDSYDKIYTEDNNGLFARRVAARMGIKLPLTLDSDVALYDTVSMLIKQLKKLDGFQIDAIMRMGEYEFTSHTSDSQFTGIPYEIRVSIMISQQCNLFRNKTLSATIAKNS